MWIVSINEEESIMGITFIEFLESLQHPTDSTKAEIVLARHISSSGTNFQDL
jgi:hypothetical protein